MMLSKTFGEKLKQARKEKGVAQVDVARLLDARGSATVHRWEAGQSFPGLEAVDKLAEYFQRPVHWFFLDESATQCAPVPPNSGGPGGQPRIAAQAEEAASQKPLKTTRPGTVLYGCFGIPEVCSRSPEMHDAA